MAEAVKRKYGCIVRKKDDPERKDYEVIITLSPEETEDDIERYFEKSGRQLIKLSKIEDNIAADNGINEVSILMDGCAYLIGRFVGIILRNFSKKKQLVIIWIIGVIIAISFLDVAFNWNSGSRLSLLINFNRFLKAIAISLPFLIIGGLLIYTLKDKKK